MTLPDLISRVREAKRPSRELDVRLRWAVVDKDRAAAIAHVSDDHLRDRGIPLYTDSLDAITALIERVLPDLVIKATKLGDGSGEWQIIEAWLADTGDEIVADLVMPSRPPALAFCETLLLALQERETTDAT